MTWLTATRFLCHKWPRIFPVCRYHNSVLFSFMTYHRVCNKSNTRSATYGTGTAYLSLFVLLSFFFWSLYMHFLALRDLRLLITPNIVSVLTQTTKQNHIHHVLFYFTPWYIAYFIQHNSDETIFEHTYDECSRIHSDCINKDIKNLPDSS